MILPDVNLLIYAYNDQTPDHEKAKDWWERCLNGREHIGLTWIVINGYLRLMTHPRILTTPLQTTQATTHIRDWLTQPAARLVEPGTRFPDIFLGYLETLGTAANLTTDAYLASLAQEHQAEIHSNDTDFARFSGLRWSNPLL